MSDANIPVVPDNPTTPPPAPEPKPQPRPGWQTTEFYLSLAGYLGTLLVLTRIISSTERDALYAALVQSIEGIVATIGGVTIIVKYISSRMAVKTAAFQPVPPVEKEAPEPTFRKRIPQG